jgi:hypothetical protein
VCSGVGTFQFKEILKAFCMVKLHVTCPLLPSQNVNCCLQNLGPHFAQEGFKGIFLCVSGRTLPSFQSKVINSDPVVLISVLELNSLNAVDL